MSVLPVGIGADSAAGSYQIERSLRFNSADSAYLNRTPASAGNRKTWTWSGWVKRGTLGSGISGLFGAGSTTNTGSTTWIGFNADSLGFSISDGDAYYQSTAVYRDPSAWYHIVGVFDSDNATASNRMQLYVNGVRITQFSTTIDATSGMQGAINDATPHSVGSRVRAGFTSYFNGYLTEVNFIDGSALDPTSFGEYNEDTGVWQPKKYTGSYGTNGFYLNFSDNSGVTSTTLGADSSGNGNNWTPNNFSVTAGAGNDSLVDTPTNYGTDTGVGGEVRGNYATLNPLDQAAGTASNGNLQWVATSPWKAIRATIGVSSGKWYWEYTPTAVGEVIIGIGKSNAGIGSTSFPGLDANGWGYYSVNGNKYNNNSASAYGNSYTTNDVIGVAFDADAGELKFYKNGVVQNSGTAAFTGLTSGPYFPMFGNENATGQANFGQRPFAYTAPSGFKALCTQNLPVPTIVDGGEYFNTVLYTGTGSSLGVTGVGFQPDWVWIKERNAAADHGLYDAVRGVQNQLESNTTTAETAEATGLTAFGTDGFTVGALAQLNTSGDTYVAWNWKANGAGVSNTAGTITSTVSANTDSGFSIVTYTGTGAAATVGHGLGAKPNIVIYKRRNSTSDWLVLTDVIDGSMDYGYLNTTSAFGAAGQTAPTSTILNLAASQADSNINGGTFVAYCFAAIPGYSAFGSYTGNGSADGPFVYTGFRPAWVMVKRTDTSGASWNIFDTSRSTFNQATADLFADSSSAEVSYSGGPDILSNGFKVRGSSSNTDVNASGATYIYMAFAENPFKYALAR